MKRIPLFRLLVAGVPVAWVLGGCTPTLDSLTPNSGQTHTLVEANGSNKFLTGVYWDAATPGETNLNRSLFGGGPISVPHTAANGAHGVQLRNSAGSSATRTFTVTPPPTPFPAPRLEYITTCCWDAGATPGTVKFFVLTQSADVDVHAQIRIGGIAQDTLFLFGLRYDDGGIAPATLGYPVYHYGMHATPVEAAIGAAVNVSMVNDGGAVSNTLTYTVPAADQRDDDGDGLLNEWEINGYDADGDGTIDVDLPALGADPNHKDIFVEVDFMNGKVPAGDPWTPVETAFAEAPVLNLAGGPGIHLHVDRGQANWTDSGGVVHTIPVSERDGGTILPFSNYIRYDNSASPCASPGETTVNFLTLKGTNFDAARLNVFHYSIFANSHGYTCGSSGRGEIWGNDFFVTLTNASLANVNRVTGTFMHEFGHNLNLRHGGGDDGDNTQREPNHLSIMSYRYQFPGVDIDCDATGDAVYDYSRGRLALLNEAALNENAGICNNVAIDWNGNGAIENPVVFDIDGSAQTLHDDFNSWGRLYFNFRATGSGWGGS